MLLLFIGIGLAWFIGHAFLFIFHRWIFKTNFPTAPKPDAMRQRLT